MVFFLAKADLGAGVGHLGTATLVQGRASVGPTTKVGAATGGPGAFVVVEAAVAVAVAEAGAVVVTVVEAFA